MHWLYLTNLRLIRRSETMPFGTTTKSADFSMLMETSVLLYEPFITPGDVLAAIMGQFHPDLGAMEETLVSFLQKELLSDEFVNLEQAGHELDEGIPLARVFVDLPTVDEPTVGQLLPGVEFDAFVYDEHEVPIDNGFIKQILLAASERLNLAASGGTEVVRTLDSAVTQDVRGRFVLIGGPGQGKTTLGQFICQIFRASIISQRPRQTLSREVSRALSIIRDQCESEDINDGVVPRFPFRLSLNDFASALSNSPETGSEFSIILFGTANHQKDRQEHHRRRFAAIFVSLSQHYHLRRVG